MQRIFFGIFLKILILHLTQNTILINKKVCGAQQSNGRLFFKGGCWAFNLKILEAWASCLSP